MKYIKYLIAILMVSSFVASCEKDTELKVEYLEVNANNISGQWELSEWNGAGLMDGTYVYLDIVRNDRTYTMYQNLDSFLNVPHTVTGSYFLETDPELGAIIRGNYDHDSGDWAHRYIIKDLTATEMTWIAKDDESFVQKFVRIDNIPVE
ncbi:MAG: hypothetical protein E7124_02980 [Bacteroidales bacterium]|nr:hypothetical protein [Bacteroidales bacterium]MBQ8484336.1 lipocalin family protein [Bacteroidales bacterium]MBR2128328.1 lipocalin family protein [Bacteroidales bacterium]